jgi:uncharacterized protein involved in exopolysaccharide biosynthesis
MARLRRGEPDDRYVLDMRQVRDSDFIDLSVESSSGALAEQIANAHAQVAIQYVAELRALPARAAKEFLTTRLAATRARFDELQLQAARTPSRPDLEQDLRTVRDEYVLIERKLAEAEVKSNPSYTARSMQVVSPAVVPARPDTRKMQLQLGMAGIGSLVAGVLLAILLDLLPRTRVLRRILRPSHPSRRPFARAGAIRVGEHVVGGPKQP